MSHERFIEIVTADQPESRAYFTYGAALGTRACPTLDHTLAREFRALSLEHPLDLGADGAQLLDARDQAEFEGAHARCGSWSPALAGIRGLDRSRE